jgi:hypothetical protein
MIALFLMFFRFICILNVLYDQCINQTVISWVKLEITLETAVDNAKIACAHSKFARLIEKEFLE